MFLDVLGQVNFRSKMNEWGVLLFNHDDLDGGASFEDVFFVTDGFFGGERPFADNHSDLRCARSRDLVHSLIYFYNVWKKLRLRRQSVLRPQGMCIRIKLRITSSYHFRLIFYLCHTRYLCCYFVPLLKEMEGKSEIEKGIERSLERKKQRSLIG